MATFTGFPKQTSKFLRGLSKNNSKKWFDAHRDDYEAYWVAPAKDFVAAVGEKLVKLAPKVCAEPRVNGSIFRINRDIRFSKDKTPYKDHLDFWFWEGKRKGAVSGFFLRITPTKVFTGVGAHGFEKDKLAKYRKSVVHASKGKALLKAVEAVERAGYEVGGEHYKKLPRGFDAAGEAERLLRFNALWATDEAKVPASLGSGKFVDYCMTRWRKMAPLHRWLVDSVQ